MHDLLVQGPDDVVELPAGVADVLDLGLEELVALAELGELLQGQGVDRTQGGQLGLQLLDAGGRVGALGQLGRRGGQGVLGRAGQIVAEGLDHRLPSDGGLHQVQLDLLQAAPGCGQLVLAGRALPPELLQAGAAGLDRLQLQPVALPQLGQGRVQPGLGSGDHLEEPGHRGGVGFQPGPALGRLADVRRHGRSAAAPPPASRSVSTRRRSTRPADRTSHSLRSRAASAIRSSMAWRSWRAAATRPPAAARASSSRGSSARRADGPGRVPDDALVELGVVAADLLELGGQRHQVAGHPLVGHPGRLVGHLVPVVGPHRLGRRRSSPPRPRPAPDVRSSVASPAATAATIGPAPGPPPPAPR